MALNENLSEYLKRGFTALREKLAKVREEIRQLRMNETLRSESCEDKVSKLEGNILNIKWIFLRNNVIISGIKLNDNDLINSVVFQLNSILEIKLREIEINNIYKLGRDRPVVKIEFMSLLAKSKLLHNRCKGTEIFINEDFIEEDRADY